MNAVGNLGVVNWHEDTKFDNASAKTGMNTRKIFSVFVQIIAPCPLPKPTGFGIFIAEVEFSGSAQECPKVNLQMKLDKGLVEPLNHSKTRQTTLSLLVPAMIFTRIRRRVPPEKPVPGRCRVRFSVGFCVKHIQDIVVVVVVAVEVWQEQEQQ